MIQFGDFIFDSSNERIFTLADGRELPLEPKLIALLALLLRQPNTIISRDELHEQLWAGSLVTDNAINKLVGNLRKALGDEAKDPRYIQTIPKRGYRLVCMVSPRNMRLSAQRPGVPTDNVSKDDVKDHNSRLAPLYKIAAVIVFLVVTGFIYWQQIPIERDPPIGYSVPLTRAKGIEFSPRLHPDSEHVYYLHQVEESREPELWLMNQATASVKRIRLAGRISSIIKVYEDPANKETHLIYLTNSQKSCSVNQALLSNPTASTQIVKDEIELFDCTGKRIRDMDYHEQQHTIYYTAQPENLWPNQIFAYDIAAKKAISPAQPTPKGWGHHSIDISPNGQKLLIMSTDNDHSTQLYSLNLLSHDITEGVKFNRPVAEAIWHHDSKHIYYHSSPPSYQILKSDFNGKNAEAVISVSDELSLEMLRIPDGRNLLFSTDQRNYNNRWLVGGDTFKDISNSTVADISPIMFHHSEHYIFASKRSGYLQLYLGGYKTEDITPLTKFHAPYSIGYMAVSFDDKHVLISVSNKVFHLPMRELIGVSPFTAFDEKYLIYVSDLPIISLDWFGKDKAAVTIVKNGTPQLIVVDQWGKEIALPNVNGAYGLTDSEYPTDKYIIEQKSNALYYIGKNDARDQSLVSLSSLLNLPEQFYHAKVDHRTLYYMTTENDVEFLHIVPLRGEEKTTKLPLYRFSNYDVTGGKIIVSDMLDREGDIYRTVQ